MSQLFQVCGIIHFDAGVLKFSDVQRGTKKTSHYVSKWPNTVKKPFDLIKGFYSISQGSVVTCIRCGWILMDDYCKFMT